MADARAATVRHTLRFLAAALLGSEVSLLMVVTVTTGPNGGFRQPPVWAFVLLAVVVAVAGILIAFAGYRLPAILPDAEPEKTRATVLRAIRSTTMLRFAISEVVAFISFALGFLVGDGGAIVCLVVTRVRSALERDGGQSHLDEVLDSPPASGRS
jgi:hypothetical protein